MKNWIQATSIFVMGLLTCDAASTLSPSGTDASTPSPSGTYASTPSPSGTFSSTSFADGMDKRFKRTSFYQDVDCNIPSSCQYRCSRGYHVWVYNGLVTFEPPKVDGCTCATLRGHYKEPPNWAGSSDPQWSATYDSASRFQILYLSNMAADCSYDYVEGEPPQPFVAKEYVRYGVYPSSCDVKDSCAYMCSVGYKISIVGDDKIKAEPVVANPTSTCSCYTLVATVRDDGKAVGSKDSTISYVLSMGSEDITVETTVDGVTCSGSFSPGTYVPTKAVETATSGVTTLQAMIWATIAATVLAVAISSFGHAA